MAKALYLCTHRLNPGDGAINGLAALVINKDDGQTTLQIQTSASAQASAHYGTAGLYPVAYFDTVTKISDLTSDALKDNLDTFLFLPEGAVKVEG